ncbi:MAG: S8 family serine peptidase, partial [Anaerolineae bacterium]|nr:S8 family serine peptidase [Anaerolineae bacterium]
MRKPVFNLLLAILMVLALSPASLALRQPVAAAASDEPIPPGGHGAPAHLQEVPADIRALFEGGMSAEEFVQRAGYVPRALESLVEGEALMIIEMEREPVSVVYAERKAAGVSASSASLDAYKATLETAQAALVSQLAEMDVNVISRYTVAYNGVQALVPYSKMNQIRELPGVKAIHRAPIHKPALSASVPLIGADSVQADLGFDGEGVTIAVIDTGIDYTHAVFGGSGTPGAYNSNDPDIVEAGSFPTVKVVDGYDFAGTDYDASGTYGSEIPTPDDDPLDEYGHGTHVSSIAAGIAAGDVMTGVAPAADLIALKVFGAAGSTSLVVDALEWATDWYLTNDTPPLVINMSLGSDFGTGSLDDPDVLASKNAVEAGIVVVASAGNDGDSTFITGAPATADGTISVASSEDGYSILDGFEVTSPASIAGVHPGLQSVAYDWTSTELPISGELVYPGIGSNPAQNQRTGCYTFDITNTALITGNIVLLDWTTPSCGGSVARAANAVAAGAIGVLMVDDSAIFDLYITGSSVVPAYSIPLPIGNVLKATLATDSVEVVMTADYTASTPYVEPASVDVISSFSSRGPRGVDAFLKPEITAPGGSIYAANMGSGTGGVSMGGTSMASPHIAGVAALMAQAHPSWTPEAIKSAIMNTAVDMADGTPIVRSGAGRVDALSAVGTDVIATGDPNLVSLSWGLIKSSADSVTITKTVTLKNAGATAVTYDAAWAFQVGSMTVGADMAISPLSATVAAGADAVFVVSLEVDMTAVPVGFDVVVEEYYGFVTFSPVGGAASDALRVPFYFQPRPYSELTFSGDTFLEKPATDTAVISVEHSGVAGSDLWIYPALSHNAAPDPAMAGPGDVRLFGMDYGWTSATYGDIIAVAVDAWDYWHVPQPMHTEFDLYLDVNEDGTADFVDFNYNYGYATGGDGNNDWIVLQVDLSDGAVYLASPWNIYTDYNSSFMEYYLPAGWQALGLANPDFDYELYGYDWGGEMLGAAGSFDYSRAPLSWFISENPGPADPSAVALVEVFDLDGYLLSQAKGIMFADYNG